MIAGSSTFADQICDTRERTDPARAVLAAVSGIDGSGKGYVTAAIVAELEGRGVRVAGINIDGWLHLPRERFDAVRPAEHFYLHAIRFDALFAELVLPLRDQRRVSIEYDLAAETATSFVRKSVDLHDIDVIVLEGIYLLKRELRPHYDLSLWIECGFETALERALARGQEGLDREATVHAYHTIYFPAQAIHFARDDPRRAATAILLNDPRLAS